MNRFAAFALACGVALWSLSPGIAAAQDTHLLLITGVSGEEALASQYQKWAAAVIAAARKGGVAEANITYLSEMPDRDKANGRASREGVEQAIAALAKRSKPDDDVFILLIGHGSYDGKVGAFNLMGPDLSVADFDRLLSKLPLQRIAFVNTASSSGAFLGIAGPNRAVVAATKTGGERNDTRFPEFFVEALSDEAADRDRNGRVSLLEAFDYARTKVVAAFEKGGHILTEHATLDDRMEGKFAGTLYLAPQRARDAATAAAASADPALRALLEQQEALERQISALRLKKDSMDATQYEQQLEKLVTELAVKTREIRERQKK